MLIYVQFHSDLGNQMRIANSKYLCGNSRPPWSPLSHQPRIPGQEGSYLGHCHGQIGDGEWPRLGREAWCWVCAALPHRSCIERSFHVSKKCAQNQEELSIMASFTVSRLYSSGWTFFLLPFSLSLLWRARFSLIFTFQITLLPFCLSCAVLWNQGTSPPKLHNKGVTMVMGSWAGFQVLMHNEEWDVAGRQKQLSLMKSKG